MTTISTTRMMLRPVTKSTAQQTSWLRNPKVVRFSEQRHKEHTLSTQLKYISRFVGPSRLWGLYLVSNGEHIGNISASHDEFNNVTEVGMMIGETDYWGKGYGLEAWKAVCNWLLDKDCGHVRRLEAGCMKSNVAMMRIIQATKFRQEGELLNRFVHEGGLVSCVLFGRLA